ncbi:MAG: hypothetical protein NT075_22980 [Chloroflexi bacterium]|nr:hypothetical protein [Chloroflexota bacterium]
MYKAKGRRAKDEVDFQACLPVLDQAAKVWLRKSLYVLHPEGHPWLDLLTHVTQTI